MPLAIAALTSTGAVLAADSLLTTIGSGRVAGQRMTSKVARVGACAVMLTGVSTVENLSLRDELVGAVSPHTGVTDAAAAAVAALEAACPPLAPYVPELLEGWESLWDVVLAVEEQPGAVALRTVELPPLWRRAAGRPAGARTGAGPGAGAGPPRSSSRAAGPGLRLPPQRGSPRK